MPAELPNPPTVAESRDSFTTLRVLDVLARVPRSVPLEIRSIADQLNAIHLDWLFEARVVADTILQLQANWMADYRNSSGIVIDESLAGATVTIEDSSRVDPWIVRQAQRELGACRAVLVDFSQRDRPTGES
jgi:hypothetical protein